MTAAAAMALSSLSVVTNADRLRRFHPEPFPTTVTAKVVAPAVEIGADPEFGSDSAPASETVDPVCGMTVNPATALTAQHQGHDQWFCSPGCREPSPPTPTITWPNPPGAEHP